MVRRGEASTGFVLNEDVVSITADDDDDPKQQASAEVLKALLNNRQRRPSRWFLTIVGVLRGRRGHGVSALQKPIGNTNLRYLRTELRPRCTTSMPEWDDEKGEVGTESFDLYEKIKDRPYIDLIAPENFRFQPGCELRNPVVSSPYIIELLTRLHPRSHGRDGGAARRATGVGAGSGNR